MYPKGVGFATRGRMVFVLLNIYYIYVSFFGAPFPNIISNILKVVSITYTKNNFMAKTFLKEFLYFCF